MTAGAMQWGKREVEAGEPCFEALKQLKEEGFNVLVDLTAVDWSALSSGAKGDASDNLKRAVPAERSNLTHDIFTPNSEEFGTPRVRERLTPEQEKFFAPRPKRFEVIYRVARIDPQSGEDKGRVEVRAFVDGSAPELRSVAGLWPIANWLEREIWDMFGIKFADRPDIKRLLLYEEFQGHPLRKDYPITKRQPLIGPANGERPDSPTFNIIKPTVKFD
jgi:NADH:ubiquinone oxidoreductase subunit C